MPCCSKSVFAAVAGAAAGISATLVTVSQPTEQPVEVRPASFAQPEGQPSLEEMMEFMKQWAAPVDQHEVLKAMEGTWHCEANFGPARSKGQSTMQIVLGGRYITQHFTLPDFMGAPFEGMGAIGFDKAKEAYVTVWIDSFSTGLMLMEGQYDEASRTMTWKGDASTPMGMMPVKHVIRHVSDDEMLMEFFETAPGAQDMQKSGQIVYTRAN